MRFPQALLRLLPMWQYSCPGCGEFLGYEAVTECIKCGTSFTPEQARVPPQFLGAKDEKDVEWQRLSKYVHGVLAPKLGKKMQAFLFQFFTDIFTSGFETGNLSEWTGTAGSPAVVTAPVHHGTYSAEFDSSGEYAHKTFTPQTTVFVRLYARINTLPSGTQVLRFMYLRGDGGSTGICYLFFGYGAGSLRFGLTRSYPSSATAYYAYAYEINTWYCLEVKFVKASGTSGEYRVYLNGTEVITDAGIDTSGAPDVDNIRVGQGYSNYVVTNWIDCVKVADTYIGPEAEVTYVNVSDGAAGGETVSRPERLMTLLDQAAGADMVTRPHREMTLTDVASGLEALFKLRELAAVTDGAAGLELVTVGVAGVVKTKIFLILGDLAIQLTGD